MAKVVEVVRQMVEKEAVVEMAGAVGNLGWRRLRWWRRLRGKRRRLSRVWWNL